MFGHMSDNGGMVPGSIPIEATTIYQEGIRIPPVKLYDKGVLNEGVYRIVGRNSRLAEHLIGLDDERLRRCAADAHGGQPAAVDRQSCQPAVGVH